MRNKLFNKLGILLLAVIFLMSMASYSTTQNATAQGKGNGNGNQKPDKPDKPGKPGDSGGTPELYKVTISIIGAGPGFKTNEEALGCGSLGYFYATASKGKYLLNLESDGILTLGPENEVAPLTMWVHTGEEEEIILEGYTFEDDACHGNLDGYYPNNEGIFFRFLKSQDGTGFNQDIEIRWFLDFIPGPKKHGVGWHLHSLRGDFGPDTVMSTDEFPVEGLTVGVPWFTDVKGTFRLLHDGIGLGDYDPTNIDILLHDFHIRLEIERL